MSWQKFRERANLFLYGNKEVVLGTGKILNIIVSLIAIATLVYYYGFQLDLDTSENLLMVIKFSFLFYVVHYLLRFIYDFHPIVFLRQTWFEGVLMFLLTIEGISYNLFDILIFERIAQYLGVINFSDLSTLFIQIYFLIAVIIGLGKGGNVLPRFKLNPALIFIASFAIIIFAGTGLLMLPEMSNTLHGMNFLDALFTSTSASCVTGLMVEDTPSFSPSKDK